MTAIIVLSPEASAEATRNIVGALAESDLDIYWPQTARGASEGELLNRLHDSRCAIIVWTVESLRDANSSYRSLASLAAQADKAILVRLDNNPIDEELSKLTVYDLRGWRSQQSSLFMLDLVAAAKSKAAGLDPPLQRAPRQLLLRRLAVAVPSAIAAIAVIVGLYRDVGLDKVAGPEERTSWAAIEPGSCDDLREHLKRFPEGAYQTQANSLLQARKLSQTIVNRQNEREMDVYASERDSKPQPSENAARNEAMARADGEAQKICARLAQDSEAVLKSWRLSKPETKCSRSDGGTVCRVNAVALCRLEEPEPVEVETCHAG